MHATSCSRKRSRSLQTEEELELLEECQPLAISTPNVSSYTVPDILVCSVHLHKCVCVCVCVCVCRIWEGAGPMGRIWEGAGPMGRIWEGAGPITCRIWRGRDQ